MAGRAGRAPLAALAALAALVAVVGACSSGARPNASVPVATGAVGPSVAAPASWTTYQHDQQRSGVVADRISPAVHRAWKNDQLDGAVYAQPLLVGDAVIVATEHDSVYRLDAATGAVRWRANLGEPVPGGALECGNIDPLGITGTPVVDVAAGLVWAVDFVQPKRHELVAIDLATGAVRDRRGVDPPGSDPGVQNQRSALSLANGRVYVLFGGLFGDCGRYHGWVVATPAVAAPPEPALTTFSIPTPRGGGFWAPSGAVVDSGGALFVTSGNSFSARTYDMSNSVLALSADLKVHGSFAPTGWAELNGGDTDLGSIGPALVGDGLVFQTGKSGVGYLLAADRLGGVGGALFEAAVCPGSGSFGGTASAPPMVFVPCRNGLVALAINGHSFSVAWRGPRESVGPPVVTKDLVWTVVLDSGELVGMDRVTGEVRTRVSVGKVPHFAAPAVGDGRVVVPSGHGVVAFSG